jgi:fructose-1,6-bisphosphatase II / sedoheptulose-1,7-bisphosphatase
MDINKSLIELFANSTERGAFGASKFNGKNDKIAADQAAVNQMRTELNKINMNGKVVIGEGEMDEAPMLYIGERIGTKNGDKLDIAVDPLEGTNFTAKNLPNALSVIAVSREGNLLHAPDMYMEKIAIGSNLPKNIIDLDYSVKKNIKSLADAKNVSPNNLVACLLDRTRHSEIVNDLNEMGVKISFISDGDISGAMSVSNIKKNADIFLGIGGAPEGVLAAAALKCLGCQMQTRLVFQNTDEKKRAEKLGVKDLNKKYFIDELVKGDVIFCASGVTDGDLVKGIHDFGDYYTSETLVLHYSSKTNKIIKKKTKK